MKFRVFAFILCLLGVPVAAWAQAQGQQQGYPLTLTGTRFDAAQGTQVATPAVTAQTTLTIPAGNSGQRTYITNWSGGACLSGAVSLTSVQANWTTTNMNGLAEQTSVISGSTVSTNAGQSLCDRFSLIFPTGLASSCAACVVTLVSPASVTNVSFPQLVTYYYAP